MPGWQPMLALLLLALPAAADEPGVQIAACIHDAAKAGRREPPGSGFDDMVAALEGCAEKAPKDAALRVRLARTLWKRAHEDGALAAPRKQEYVARALGHADAALRLDAENFEATVLKGVLTVLTAESSEDPARRAKLLEDAASIKKQALALKAAGLEPRVDPYESLFVPPAPPVPGGPQRIGGAIKEPKKVKHVNPRYPEPARNQRVQGVVILEAVIGTDGKVQSLKVLRGVPFLDAPAMEAVRQWEYTPTLLEGKPVPVIMVITVNFRLS